MAAGLLRVFDGLLDGAFGRESVSGGEDFALGQGEAVDDGGGDEKDGGDQIGAIFLEEALETHNLGFELLR